MAIATKFELRRIGLVVTAALSLVYAQSAAAAVITLDNYIFDLGAASIVAADAGFAGFGTIGTVGVNGVDQIAVSGIGHVHLADPNGNVAPDPGESIAADILLRATSFPDVVAGVTTGGKVNELHYEMTFSFSVAAAVGTVLPDGFGGLNASFAHLPGSVVDGAFYDGILDIYVDSTPDAVGDETLSNPTATGVDFTNGVKIASFMVIPGGGGTINTRTLDGHDDATFVLISALPGVILDLSGADIGIPGMLLGISDTNFDLDPDDDGLPNSAPAGGWPAPDAGGFGFTAPGTFANAYFEEGGSVDLGIESPVPEPMSLLTWVSLTGLVGAGVVARRRLVK
jgi:hypothetical protein